MNIFPVRSAVTGKQLFTRSDISFGLDETPGDTRIIVNLGAENTIVPSQGGPVIDKLSHAFSRSRMTIAIDQLVTTQASDVAVLVLRAQRHGLCSTDATADILRDDVVALDCFGCKKAAIVGRLIWNGCGTNF